MRKVLITGATGFIGEALLKKLLNKNFEVWVIVRDIKKLDRYKQCKNLKVLHSEMNNYCNLLNKINERNFDCFFHIAWDGVFGNSFGDYEKQIMNVKYTCDALCLAKNLKCRKFIFIGSFVEYEVKKYIASDSNNMRIATIYGMSKLASEIICKTLSGNEIIYNGICPAQVFGEGDNSRMLSRVLLENLILGKSIDLSEGKFLYDWIYLDDLIDGIIAVYEKGRDGRTYYLGHRKLKTFKDIVVDIQEIVNKEVKLNFGTYPDNALIDYENVKLDALYQDTGFEVKSDFKDSILKTVEWIKKDLNDKCMM